MTRYLQLRPLWKSASFVIKPTTDPAENKHFLSEINFELYYMTNCSLQYLDDAVPIYLYVVIWPWDQSLRFVSLKITLRNKLFGITKPFNSVRNLLFK